MTDWDGIERTISIWEKATADNDAHPELVGLVSIARHMMRVADAGNNLAESFKWWREGKICEDDLMAVLASWDAIAMSPAEAAHTIS